MISNNGARESGFSQAYAGAYDHPGHVIVVSTGDNGYTAASFPANLASVTVAGGTQLARARNARGWSERVWNVLPSPVSEGGASGSGCSAYVAKPAWQHDPHCLMRTVADVGAVAWNVPIYEKVQGGWLTLGGTSVSAPLIAGVYGLAGNATTITPGYEYSHARSLFDITAGNNDWFFEGGAAHAASTTCASRRRDTTARRAWVAPTAPARFSRVPGRRAAPQGPARPRGRRRLVGGLAGWPGPCAIRYLASPRTNSKDEHGRLPPDANAHSSAR